MDSVDVMFIVFVGVMMFVFGLMIGETFGSQDISISQETGDDICRNLTGNESSVAYEIFDNNNYKTGKLGCDIPSYDSTQNIIIKKNNE